MSKWLKVSKRVWLNKPKKQRNLEVTLVNPMRERVPFSYPYESTFGNPYKRTYDPELSSSEGGGSVGIAMDPEKNVGLGIGGRPND